MKKKYLFNVLFVALLVVIIVLPSCDKNELENENIVSGTRIITFDVSHAFNEDTDESARALPIKPDTIYQKFDSGLEIQTYIEKDKVSQSRDVTLDPVSDETKVLAFVIDVQHSSVYRIQELEVTKGKLTCEIPTNLNVYIVFYSYNSRTKMPTTLIKEGDDINVPYARQYEEYTVDLMRAETGTITPSTTSLGNITFTHLFSKARIYLHCDTPVTEFSATFKNCGYQRSSVNVLNGNPQSILGAKCTISLKSNVYGMPQKTIFSSYGTLVPGGGIYGDLDLVINNSGITRTVPSIKCDFKAGYSYTIHVNIKNKKIVTGWSPNYYQWSASAAYLPDTNPQEGDKSFNNGNADVAENFCMGSPTLDDIKRMIPSGVYWDDEGPTWKDLYGNAHATGVWVMKKEKWGAAGNIGLLQYVLIKKATDEQRYSDDYVFLPASGFLRNGTVYYIGNLGYYWITGGYSVTFSDKSIYISPIPLTEGNSVFNF